MNFGIFVLHDFLWWGISVAFSVNYTVHLLKTVETQRCRCWRGGSLWYKEACLQYSLSIHIEGGIPLCPTTPVTAVWNSGGCRGYMVPASQKSTFHVLQCMAWKGFAKTGLCWWLARKTRENFRLCSKTDFEIWFEVCPWTNFVLCHRADLGNDPQKSGRGHAMPVNSKFKLTSLFSTLVTLQTLSWSFLIMTDDVAFPVYSKQSSRDEETWSPASCERASLANPWNWTRWSG